MKKIKNLILVSVLFSFTFLVCHDVMVETGEFPSYWVVMDEKKALDTSGEIHKALHLFLAVTTLEYDLPVIDVFHLQPFCSIKNLTSSIELVLERPPLL